jgi:hypothetical protein
MPMIAIGSLGFSVSPMIDFFVFFFSSQLKFAQSIANNKPLGCVIRQFQGDAITNQPELQCLGDRTT